MESQQRLEVQPPKVLPKELIHPYICLSRETGVDCSEIASLIAAKSGWQVLDRELLDYMAEHNQWSPIALDSVDERSASWFHETFGKWLDDRVVSQAEYVKSLGKVVLMAAQHESTIFVGRGAQFYLPREVGVSVRIIAPRKLRIERIMVRRHCSRHDAENFVEETDAGRAAFIRRYFHHNVAEPHLYDLVINLEHTTREAAAALILSDYKLRIEPV
jgi:cytidylate kinase